MKGHKLSSGRNNAEEDLGNRAVRASPGKPATKVPQVNIQSQSSSWSLALNPIGYNNNTKGEQHTSPKNVAQIKLTQILKQKESPRNYNNNDVEQHLLYVGNPSHKQSDTLSTVYGHQSGRSLGRKRQSIIRSDYRVLLNEAAKSSPMRIEHAESSKAIIYSNEEELKEPDYIAEHHNKSKLDPTLENFRKITELGYVPENCSSPPARMTCKNKEDQYMKYQSCQQDKTTPIRPFYKWKDGFIDNYLKYCSPESIIRRAKKIRIPEEQSRTSPKKQISVTQQMYNKTYLEGFYTNQIKASDEQLAIIGEEGHSMQQTSSNQGKSSSFKENPSYEQSLLQPVYGNDESDYMLKTSLFNNHDRIAPINKYYYDKLGAMSIEGPKRRPYDVKSYIDKSDKDLVLAQLTQEYGGKAVRIMNAIDKNHHRQSDKIFEEYESFRLSPLPATNSEILAQYSKDIVDKSSRMNYQLQFQTGSSPKNNNNNQIHKSSNETTLLEGGFLLSESNSIYKQQARQPIAIVNIRLNKVKVYLNALTEDGHFECKYHHFKISDIQDMDNSSFLVLCQEQFKTRSTLKYIFAEDGTQIINLHQSLNNCEQYRIPSIFVSTYPYFIGQKDIISQNTSLKQTSKILASDASMIAAVLDADINQMSPFPTTQNPQEILMYLKQRHHTPSLIAKRTEIKANFKYNSQYNSPNHSGASFFSSKIMSSGPRDTMMKQSLSPFKRRTVFRSPAPSSDMNIRSGQYQSDNMKTSVLSSEETSKISFFPQLPVQPQQTEQIKSRRKSETVQSISKIPVNLNDLSFKDYVSTFSKDDDFTQKPYAKFYSDAIKKHREQLYTQMSQMNTQKNKIIDNLRISEDEMTIPQDSKQRLGELLNRQKPNHQRNIEDGIYKAGSNLVRNIQIAGKNESGLILTTLDNAVDQNMRTSPSNKHVISVVQIISDEEELVKLQKISGQIIERALLATSKISLINKESLYASLLHSWFVRYKQNSSQTPLNQQSSRSELETKIFNSIRQANIQAQNRKSNKYIQLEIRSLKEDLQKLFIFLQRQQNSIIQPGAILVPLSTTSVINDSMIADLVQAVGLTKLDVEGYGNRLSMSRPQLEQQQIDSPQIDEMSISDGYNNQSLQPRVNVEDSIAGSSIRMNNNVNPFQTGQFHQSQYKTIANIETKHFELLFDKLSNSLFSQEELQSLRQIYHIIVYALGSTISINLQTLKVIQDEQYHLFEDEDVKDIILRLFNLPKESLQQITWNQFLEVIQKLRLEKIIKQMQKEINKEQQFQTFGGDESIFKSGSGSTKKMILSIFESIGTQSQIEPNAYFKAFLSGIDSSEDLQLILGKHTEMAREVPQPVKLLHIFINQDANEYENLISSCLEEVDEGDMINDLTPLAEEENEEDEDEYYISTYNKRTHPASHLPRVSPIYSPCSSSINRQPPTHDFDETIPYSQMHDSPVTRFDLRIRKQTTVVDMNESCSSKASDPRSQVPEPERQPKQVVPILILHEQYTDEILQGKSSRSGGSLDNHPEEPNYLQSSPESMSTPQVNESPVSSDQSSEPQMSASSFKQNRVCFTYEKQQQYDINVEEEKQRGYEDEETGLVALRVYPIESYSPNECAEYEQADLTLSNQTDECEEEEYGMETQRIQQKSENLSPMSPTNYNEKQVSKVLLREEQSVQVEISDQPILSDLRFVHLYADSIIPRSSSKIEQLSSPPPTHYSRSLIQRSSSQSKEQRPLQMITRAYQSFSPSTEKRPFLERMRDSEIKKKLNLEYLRQEKQMAELSNVRASPSISQKSRLLIVKRNSRDFYQEQMKMSHEYQRKIEEQRFINDQQNLKEVTGKPIVSEKAQNIPKRGVEVLMSWHKENQQKRDERFVEQGRRHLQMINTHLEKSGKYLAKGSLKYLSSKENMNVSVEDRLLKFGDVSNAKKEQSAHEKENQQILLANKLHQRRTAPIQTPPLQEENISLATLNPTELKKLKYSKSRQEFYSKYLSIKKLQPESPDQIKTVMSMQEPKSFFISFGNPEGSIDIQQNNRQKGRNKDSFVKSLTTEARVNFNTNVQSQASIVSKPFISPEQMKILAQTASNGDLLQSPPRKQFLDFTKIQMSPQAFSNLSKTSSQLSLRAYDLYQKLLEDAALTNIDELLGASQLATPSKLSQESQTHHYFEDWKMQDTSNNSPNNQMSPPQYISIKQEMSALQTYNQSKPQSSYKKNMFKSKIDSETIASTILQQNNKQAPKVQFYEKCKQWDRDKRIRLDSQRAKAMQKMMSANIK